VPDELAVVVTEAVGGTLGVPVVDELCVSSGLTPVSEPQGPPSY